MGKSEFILQFVVFGTTAVIVGLLVLRLYPAHVFKKTILPSEPHINNVAAISEFSPPTSITIPSLNLDLQIAAGVISANQWTLYEDKVSWLSTSETPGKGNVILYAHNRAGLFGNLKNVKVGDKINLEAGSKGFTYRVSLKQKVTPDNVDVILSKDDQITLYTCDGSFDQKRLIVVATRSNLN